MTEERDIEAEREEVRGQWRGEESKMREKQRHRRETGHSARDKGRKTRKQRERERRKRDGQTDGVGRPSPLPLCSPRGFSLLCPPPPAWHTRPGQP